MEPSHLDGLLSAVDRRQRVLILPHNDPDPDAIASAIAVHYLLQELTGTSAAIVYKGLVGRAENKALLRYLGKPLRQATAADWHEATSIIMVDTQPGAGNNALPPGTPVAAVIDHHPLQQETTRAAYFDVRPDWGATSTILTEYLRRGKLKAPVPLATALFYGIKSDTMGLIRGATKADSAAFCHLQGVVDMEALSTIEHAQVPPAYFRRFDVAIRNARIFGDVVIAYLEEMTYPDMAAEMADLLMRLEGMRWVICMGVYNGSLMISVRTRNRKGGAGRLVQDIVGELGSAGGHGTMAGGNIPLNSQDAASLAQALGHKMLTMLKISPETPGIPLF